MTVLEAPDRAPRIQFSHFGINVRDLDRMEKFYTGVVGFEVTDRGSIPELGLTLTFMSMDPVEHHQFVICTGQKEDLGENKSGAFFGGPINQLSFRLASLDDLRIMYNRLAAENGEAKLMAGTHGIAWSVYAHDPEGNTLEFFVDSPWFIDQPFLEPVDLSKSDADLMADTENMIKDKPGFQEYGAWRNALARKMGKRVVPKPFD
jgi:catechol 2,3-dioxygenase